MIENVNATACLLDLLLWPQLVAMATFLLPAVYSTRMQTGIALAANHLILVVFPGQGHKRRFNDPSTEPQHKMQSRLFLDIIISQCTPIFKLFTSKDQSLLVRRNTFLVLNLGLDIVDSITRFDFKGDGLPR